MGIRQDNEFDYIARATMIHDLLQPNGITDERVLRMMHRLPRHHFVPRRYRERAYENVSIRLPDEQSMLPPLLVATMLQALQLNGTENVLEVGTGSGYVTALLMLLGSYVYSVERSVPVAERAAEHLFRQGYLGLDVHLGDGTQGLPDMAPFDAILVNGALPRIPKTLSYQLSPHQGRMILAVGQYPPYQLRRVRREGDRFFARTLQLVNVPRLTGRYGFDQGEG